jgi:hypothetical protein
MMKHLESYAIPLNTWCEELLHTFTTKICTHNKKNRLEVELLCSVV